MIAIVPMALFVLLWWFAAQQRWFTRRAPVGSAAVVAPAAAAVADRSGGKCARSLAWMWSRELLRSAAFATGFSSW